MTFAAIRDQYPDWGPAYPDDWRLPTETEIAALQLEFKCKYPPSFIAFQLEEARTTPMGDRAWDGFGWANRDLEPYLNLESVLSGARQMGVPDHLSPFRRDEGNFYCFDTTRPNQQGEYPVVFWDHDESAVLEVSHYQWDNFIAWLSNSMDEE